VREDREGFGALHDHVVPRDRLESAAGRVEPDRGPQRQRDLAHQLDPHPLSHPVHGRHDPAVEGGMDGLPHPQ
jgi:hypothetical protein